MMSAMQELCSDCEACGLKKHGLTRSEFIRLLRRLPLYMISPCPYLIDLRVGGPGWSGPGPALSRALRACLSVTKSFTVGG